MAISNFNMPFNVQNIQKMPIRNRPDRYAQSPLAERFRFKVSEGIHPAEYMAVYKYLPALQKDITTEDYIVIPKGRLVSAKTPYDYTVNPSGGLATPSGLGSIYNFTSAIDSTVQSVNIDDSYFGYDEYITNAIIPANGGTNFTSYYTSNDVSAGTLKFDGSAAAQDDTFLNPANRPIGAVYHDWYQDIRGKYLNYRMWPDGGHVVCDWFIEVPYVKTTAGGTTTPLGSGVTPKPTSATTADWAPGTATSKWHINKKFTYLTIDADSDEAYAGAFVKPDGIGNYDIESASTSANPTIQTVGKIISFDMRFPKSGLEDVQTYPGSNMPGTQTAGLPSFLFEFVVACQTLTGTVPTVEQVLDYVHRGYYGVARIQLLTA